MWAIAALGLAMAVMAYRSGGAQLAVQAGEPAGKSGLPPLIVDKKAPRLAPQAAPPAARDEPVANPAAAENESCYVCHGDYREEPMVGWHLKANVSCVKCHGPSHAHRDDEDNVTPPDVMYAAAEIDAACQKCHEDHLAPARKVIATWKQRCPQKTNPDDVVCTDCHGQHRRPFRTVQWDKKTRELIVRKEEVKP